MDNINWYIQHNISDIEFPYRTPNKKFTLKTSLYMQDSLSVEWIFNMWPAMHSVYKLNIPMKWITSKCISNCVGQKLFHNSVR